MNRKGLVQQIMIIIILFIVAVVIIAGYWMVSMVGPIVVGEGSNVANQIQSAISSAEPAGSGLTNASSVATSAVTDVLGVFELITYFIFIGVIIGYILVAFYVRTYPFLIGFWIFIMVALVVIAMIVSNSYQLASTDANLSAFYSRWGTNDLLMNYLPHVVAIFGMVTTIMLFVLISRDPDAEVTPI